jgi:hypothetical protein
MFRLSAITLGVAFLFPFFPAAADEGMWLPNRFPASRVEKDYGIRLSPEFLSKLQRSSVRMNNGGSASFVSPDGLVFTNHHVASECIQQLSSAETDYMKNGFHAATAADEKKCPGLEVNVLVNIEDVTARVKEGAADDAEPTEANRRRKANSTAIEKECSEATKLRCDVVALYAGGIYHLYQYRKYTDVRLVFAPEVAVAAFGGDPDNFTFPRYCLDFAFLRVYVDGKPVATPDYLPWSKTGAKNGELTLVSGHPGSTGRLATYSELEFSRDVSYPFFLDQARALIAGILDYQKRGAEQKRIAGDVLFSNQNSVKAISGFLRGLKDPELMARKRDEEKTLQSSLAGNPARQARFGKTWDEVAAAYREFAGFYKDFWLLERGAGRGSALFGLAKDIMRYAEEKTKPDAERLREFSDSRLPAVEQYIFSETPLYDDFETVLVTWYLKALAAHFGPHDALMAKVLDGLSPAEAAARYVSASRLKDMSERKRLAGSVEAVRSSEDGMIRLVRLLEPRARELRKRYEDRIESVINSASSRIAEIRFSATGADDYPDATFTLRFSYGPVKGYTNDKGEKVNWATRFDGLYRRATGQEPYVLPARWVKAKPKLRLSTPFNFVTTNDTHGGNSGSPTVNAKGEVIGILFDGNIEGLPNRFVYRSEKGERSLHVASQGIIEALRKVYNANALLKELGIP